MHIPDVLVLTSRETRRDEFRVYADHTGATIHPTDDMASAAQWWPAVPLVVVCPEMGPQVRTSTLPDTDRLGEVMALLSTP
ncbi:hypothetical protein O7605_29805 [Verrucosispora sp. WMMA2121]|uniref:hypothetical protein n=1 Tax=Verrucosispora sp. WMMA2121 TaxID=3015164 RepID=UPI0022B66987|nr:hypothetical protein [Verrucosispora sp. WMMA2121]MCZ7423710.1 hypothetical protein [Verrucosispora sp. WMMA2121]